jgi:Double-GTPase 1
MIPPTIVLVGGPDSGKTNYLARLWKSLRDGDGTLVAPDVPQDISYVEEALEHLLKGEFAPRSVKNVEESERDFSIPILRAVDPSAVPIEIVVPDVTGELWKNAVETCELPQKWMESLRGASGALLFLRVDSDQNVDPLDWVTCAELLRMHGEQKT